MSDAELVDQGRLSDAPWRKKWIILASGLAIAAVVAGWATQGERLNKQERRLVGMWQWEERMDEANPMVLYFSPKGRLIADSPPFIDPQVHKWRIENGEFTLIYSGPKLIHRLGSLLNGQKDVHPIRFEDETPIMTMPNGDEQQLILYDAPVPESFKSLE